MEWGPAASIPRIKLPVHVDFHLVILEGCPLAIYHFFYSQISDTYYVGTKEARSVCIFFFLVDGLYSRVTQLGYQFSLCYSSLVGWRCIVRNPECYLSYIVILPLQCAP